MTNDLTIEQAVGELKAMKEHIEPHMSVVGVTAYDMAIKALEQGYVLDRMKAEINEWYWQADKQALAKDPCVVDAMVDLFIRTIDKYKAESEEICEP